MWRSSITPIDQLLCQAGQCLMSCDKTQWNKESISEANKLLIAVWEFYLHAGSGWKEPSGEKRWGCGFSIIWFLWTPLWCAATMGQDRSLRACARARVRAYYIWVELFALTLVFIPSETSIRPFHSLLQRHSDLKAPSSALKRSISDRQRERSMRLITF